MTPVDEIHDSGTVVDSDGRVHELRGSISREEGELLASIIGQDPSIRRTLEVGFGYGVSALHICLATRGRPGAAHTVLDPFQHTEWQGVGMGNLERAGFADVEFIEERSEFALPRLAEQRGAAFDFVLVDGWATFDHKLLDCYYATRLLRVGGVLAIRVGAYDAGTRVVALLESWPCYRRIALMETPLYDDPPRATWDLTAAHVFGRLIGRRAASRVLARSVYERIFNSQRLQTAVLRKTSGDERNWDWHVEPF